MSGFFAIGGIASLQKQLLQNPQYKNTPLH
jgi:hypothetical protein